MRYTTSRSADRGFVGGEGGRGARARELRGNRTARVRIKRAFANRNDGVSRSGVRRASEFAARRGRPRSVYNTIVIFVRTPGRTHVR